MNNTVAPPDDRKCAPSYEHLYMTPMEFATLPSEVHHAVWSAFNADRIDSIPGKGADQSRPQRYRRDQVHTIMRDLGVALIGATPTSGDNRSTTTQAVPAPAFAAAGQDGQP